MLEISQTLCAFLSSVRLRAHAVMPRLPTPHPVRASHPAIPPPAPSLTKNILPIRETRNDVCFGVNDAKQRTISSCLTVVCILVSAVTFQVRLVIGPASKKVLKAAGANLARMVIMRAGKSFPEQGTSDADAETIGQIVEVGEGVGKVFFRFSA